MIMKNIIVPLACGLIFGAGLVIAGMTNPSKVMGFLNIFGNWKQMKEMFGKLTFLKHTFLI